MAELKRTLNFAQVSFFAAGVILGAGIYTIIGEAAGFGGNMLWLSFLIASLTALLTAFSYAELVSVFPKAGGEFVYVKNAMGINIALVVGVLVSFCGIGGGATIAVAFAGYFSQLLQLDETISTLAIIGLLFLINVIGIKQSSTFNIIFTIIETGGLLFVIYAAWPQMGTRPYFEWPPEGFNGLMVAAALSFFAFTGFEDAVKLAEETRQPEKNIPRALFTASGIVIVLYLVVVLAATSAVPFEKLTQTKSPLSVITETRFGQTGALVIAVIALFSTSNSLLSNMLGASRIVYSMAKEKNIRLLAAISEKRQTPYIALILIALVTGSLSLIGDIKTLGLFTNFFVFNTFLFVNAAVIYLRIKDKEKKRPFRIPGNINNIPIISLLAIIMILLLVGYTIYGLWLH
jgi:basic amino acid/polyamine antiporter, APA family